MTIYGIYNGRLLQNAVTFGIESREFAVFVKHPARIALAAAIISLTSFSPASSRQWKTTPELLARDYAGITDSRGGETVMLTWFVPQMMQPTATAAISMTQKYIILMVAHSRMDRATGISSFEDIVALEPKDQNGTVLAPVARNDLPPTSIAMLAGLEAILRQSLGAYGQGLKVFVFEKGDVDSCQKGQLSVQLAGENYTWDTPFPGCSRSVGKDKSADRT